ncbi:ankyrin repeat domain-containing protein, partial [Trichoderma harzianum]
MPQFRTDGPGLISSTRSLWKILRNAITDPRAGPIIIVLDALDECAESEFADLMRNVESQFRSDHLSISKSKLKYLLTCRPYEQITSKFQDLLNSFPNIRIPGEEESEVISQENVNEAYEQILNKSKEDPMVRKALSIILAASRPLTISEMNIAMDIKATTHTFHDLDLEDESDFKSRLRSWCGLFISIYHGKVYFLHQTAREFLLSDLASPTTIPSALHWHHSITTQEANNVLAELCVLYLDLFNSSVSLTIEADGKASHSTDSNAFLNYSAENWGAHFREAHIIDSAAIIPVTLRICDPGSKRFSAWFAIYQRSTYESPTRNLTDLIIASHYGHRAVVKLLVEKGADIDAKDGGGRTPLLWATYNGHKAIVELLVEKGADIEAKDNYGRTPLSWAAYNGHKAIVELLV